MSSQYQGLPGNVSRPASLLVSTASNAAPIAVTTTTNHGLTTGDVVDIDSVVGNTATNGRWTISVTGLATFTLNGSTGNGAFVSGGSVQPLVYSPESFAIPSDGDARNASSVNPAFEALADRTSYLELRNHLNGFHMLEQVAGVNDNGFDFSTGWSSTSVGGSWTDLTSTTNVPAWTKRIVQAGDLVELHFNSTVEPNSNPFNIRIGQTILAPVASPSPTYGSMVGSGVQVALTSANAPIHLMGLLVTSSTGWLYADLQAQFTGGGTATLKLVGPSTFLSRIWRPN